MIVKYVILVQGAFSINGVIKNSAQYVWNDIPIKTQMINGIFLFANSLSTASKQHDNAVHCIIAAIKNVYVPIA